MTYQQVDDFLISPPSYYRVLTHIIGFWRTNYRVLTHKLSGFDAHSNVLNP